MRKYLPSIQPNLEETNTGKYLQSLFRFDTELLYLIYDYGERSCTILIQAMNELEPPINSSTDHYKRGPNSITLVEFAKTLPKGEHQWYCAGRGFFIPYERILQLKSRLEK